MPAVTLTEGSGAAYAMINAAANMFHLGRCRCLSKTAVMEQMQGAETALTWLYCGPGVQSKELFPGSQIAKCGKKPIQRPSRGSQYRLRQMTPLFLTRVLLFRHQHIVYKAYLSRRGGLWYLPLRGDSSGQRCKDLHPKVSKDLLLGLHEGLPGVGWSQILLVLPCSAAC